MVLPGIQALFGFQLIVVFNEGFRHRLTPWQQQVHLTAIVLTVIAIAMIMAPASLHRLAEPDRATERFVHVSSRLLLGAMLPLAVSICLEVFLVAGVIWENTAASAALAFALLLAIFATWFGLPAVYRARSGRRRL